MKMQKFTRTLLCILLCVILLTSCATANKLSDTEIAQLREKYPALTEVKDALIMRTYSDTDNFASVKRSYQESSIGIVTATVTGVRSTTIQIAPIDGMPKQTLNPIFLQLHVDSVIAQKESSNIHGDISVYVGLREYEENRLDFANGTKLVISINDVGKDFNPEYCPDGYASSMDVDYYLTDDNHILAIYDLSGPKEMDGKSLDAFRQEVKNVFK